MTPIISHCDRETMRQVLKFRRKGWTWKEISEAVGINPATLNRYDRVFNLYGIEAFRA
jgi:uncharacterized protein YerC